MGSWVTAGGTVFIFLCSLGGSFLPSVIRRFASLSILSSPYFRFLLGLAGGAIIGVGFVHSFPDGVEGIQAGIDAGSLPDYPWAGLSALVGALCTIAAELVAGGAIMYVRGKAAHDHDLPQNSADNEASTFQSMKQYSSTDNTPNTKSSEKGNNSVANEDRLPIDVETVDEALPKKTKKERSAFFTEMYILLFGLSFHSIFVGCTLGISDGDLGLWLAICFHQFFEGLGKCQLSSHHILMSWL